MRLLLSVLAFSVCTLPITAAVADDGTTSISTPPFFEIAAHADVDNTKGATLTVSGGRISGASVVIPPGALINDKEEVVFSFSDKMPGLPKKPADGMAFVQNSQVFALQTTSGKINKPITLTVPYYNEQEITGDGARVVLFHYWNTATNGFENIDASPVAERISFAKIQITKIYPEAEYVSLRLAQTPRALLKSKLVPKGWKLVPSADACLKIDGPKPIGQPASATQVAMTATPPGLPSPTGLANPEAAKQPITSDQMFEATFSNKCSYTIQASACENKNGAKGCALPPITKLPAHSTETISLTAFSARDVANVGACRVSLADGTPVTYNLELSSSAANSSTLCLIKASED